MMVYHRSYLTTVAAVLLMSVAAPAIAQEKAEDAEPEKKPFTVTITGEIDAELAPVAGHLAGNFFECYPKLVERFEHPDRPAARDVRVVFDSDMRVPAYCRRDEIHVSVKWLKDHPEDIGMLTHELTHVVQAYRRGGPGWITEGLADYSRYLYGPKEQPGWELPSRLSGRRNYTDGYRVAGRFFLWMDEKHPGVVDKVHRKMQDGEFNVAQFKEFTGSTVDELWAACVKDLEKGD